MPKAHVEAPLIGSMLLAGVILKLGGYGFILLSPHLLGTCSGYIYLTLLGSVVCSLLCYRAWDIKSLVAYSSIVHIGSVTLGALCGSEVGSWVACSIMLAHSLVSPLLFLIAHALYQANYSRCFIFGHSNPLSFSFLFIFSLLLGASFGLPPFLGFWVELLIFCGLGSAMFTALFPLGLSVFFGFLYSVVFYVKSCGGFPSRLLSIPSSPWTFLSPLAISFVGPLFSSLIIP